MLLVCKMKAVQEFVKNVDYKFYQHILETLLPNVLRPIPSKNSKIKSDEEHPYLFYALI